MQPTNDSMYCFYHDKLQKGFVTTLLDGNTDNWHEVPPLSRYPVWPLPKNGIVPSLSRAAA